MGKILWGDFPRGLSPAPARAASVARSPPAAGAHAGAAGGAVGKWVAVLPAAYGGYKEVNAAWMAGALAVGGGPAAASEGSEDFQELWEERAASRA
jgi:hypothetical protein